MDTDGHDPLDVGAHEPRRSQRPAHPFEAEPPRPAEVQEARAALGRTVARIAATRERIARGEARLVDVPVRQSASEAVLAEWYALRASLCDTILALGRAQRASGTSPERMLRLVKAAAVDAGADLLREPERSMLMADVVRWSIDGFYSA